MNNENISSSVVIDDELAELFDILYEGGKLDVNEQGYLKINAYNINSNRLNDLIADLNMINSLVKIGLYKFGKEPFSMKIDIESYLKNEATNADHILHSSNTTQPEIFEPLNIAHTCSYTKVNFGNMVSTNYSAIKSMYNDLARQQALYGLQIDPYTSTAAYWVGRVQSKGAWDYKRFSPYNVGTYGYLCLNYARGQNMHTIAGGEYMGNYNYGYTGKFLFSLSTLKLGSFIVGGFKYDVNEMNDQAIITQGYNDAP
ncbi:MAG: polymorphic toxin type 44 domain-containing protein [Eubacteriaceae bacterium]|nr:polymorphic toxin type 44 domain-containing protein [Eubacteriaceae bacterium]